MFLYRRQGPKKRAKPSPPRKGRGGPPKGLPGSARDLLPLIQPATKALAQMLAGRTAPSGQLGHARAVLAQTERLVAERAHNRLNPAEREEFFEQIARLRLTLADAETEAEVEAAELQAPPPAPVSVDRERLREMALALTSPASQPPDEDNGSPPPAAQADLEPVAEGAAGDSEAADGGRPAKPPHDPNQLRLPRNVADQVDIKQGPVRSEANGRRRQVRTAEGRSRRPTAASQATADQDSDKAGDPRAANRQKLPKGWIIDDEGFVVPGAS